jgi:hypothetical protein
MKKFMAPNAKFDPSLINTEKSDIEVYLRNRLAQLDTESLMKDMVKSIMWPETCPVCEKQTGNLRFHAMHEPDADHAVLAVHIS